MLSAVVLAGCGAELTGPVPTLANGPPASELAVEPGVVCNAQVTTEVILRGDGFSPVPIDLPKAPRLALPSVTLVRAHSLDGKDGKREEILFSGDPDTPVNFDLLSWNDAGEMAFLVNQKVEMEDESGEIPSGLYDVLVRNPNENHTAGEGVLAIVDRPTLVELAPPVVCLEQGAQEVRLTGTTFLDIEDNRPALAVEGLEDALPVSLSGCTDIAHESIEAKLCTEATAELSEGLLEAGYPSLTLRNPETAACASEESFNLRVVGAPIITSVVEPLACLRQGTRALSIRGRGFLRIDGTAPTVTVAGQSYSVEAMDGCTELETMGLAVQSCQSLDITIPEDALDPGQPEITVINPDPAGCSVSNSVALTIVPPPVVTGLVPPLVCVAEGERTIEIHGSDFLTVDGAVPVVTFYGEPVESSAIEAESCADIEVQGLTVRRCDKLIVTIRDDGLEPGHADVAVTNPDPAGCTSEQEAKLRIVAPPEVTTISPSLACVSQADRSFALAGSGFLEVDGALPALTLNGVSVNVDSLQDCEELETTGMDVRSCRTVQITVAQGELDPGDTEVIVTNPAPAGCGHSASGLLIVAPPPVIVAADPALICTEESERTVVLTGTGLLRVGTELPSVTLNGTPVTSSAIDDCEPAITMEDGLVFSTCQRLTITISQGALAAGSALVVENPEPAGCSVTNSTALTIVPPPVVSELVPPLVCVAESEQTLEIVGSGFLQIDGTGPAVAFDGQAVSASSVIVADCTSLTVEGLTAQSCERIVVTMAHGALDPGSVGVTVTNPAPAGCTSAAAANLLVVPPPEITNVSPWLACASQSDRTFTLEGIGFIEIDGAIPTVDVNGVSATVDSLGDCEDVQATGLVVRSCRTADITLAQGDFASGTADIVITNPDPAGCGHTATGLLMLVPAPEVATAEPALICAEDSERTVVLTGTGFLQVGTELPTVTLNGTRVASTGVADCEPSVTLGSQTFASCQTLNVTVAQGALAQGSTLVVENPAPAGCAVTSTGALTVPPPLAIASATPSNVCRNTGGYDVTVTGTGFLRIDGTDFTLNFAGQDVSPASIGGCSPLDVNGLNAQSCTEFTVSVDSDTLDLGNVPIAVTNPAPSGCTESSSTAFRVVPPPTATGVAPNPVCSDIVTELVITGTDFVDGAQVYANSGAERTTADAVVVSSPTEMTPTFGLGLAAGTYDITVENAVGCDSTLATALTVDPTPIVFFVDPPVLYSGTAVRVTLFTSGLSADAAAVQLQDSQGNLTEISSFESPERPNKILADIPAGLTAGDYAVQVTSDLGCTSAISGQLAITDTLNLTISSIEPSYVSPTAATSVTIRGAGFDETSRVYLNPADGSGMATGLRAVVYDPSRPDELSAVVPDGLEPGQAYDVIVVNADGDVGLAEEALHVTVDEPPVITAVVPNSLANNADQPKVLLQGQGFDTGGVSVTLTCKAPSGAIGAPRAATVDASTLTGTSVEVTMPSGGVQEGSICTVTLTNDSDGAYFTYSAVSIKNPAANLNPWLEAATRMVEGRRALALVAGRPTNTSRFLYAIGGDSGQVSSAKTSVESASVGVFGDMGTWALLRNELPSARTLAGSARIGQFIYLTGGHDGTAPTNTLLRAQILDPMAGPELVDLDATLGDGDSGLDGGIWYYRVAATFLDSDASNPGGESLPGEPFPVQLPSVPQKIVLSLRWQDVPGANGYRVYRTPTADVPVEQAELLASVTCGDEICVCGDNVQCRVTDDGQTETDGTQTPLRQGSLGVWHEVEGATLGTAREGHATVAAPNPASPAGTEEWYLYVFGGRDSAGSYLSSYEWARVTVLADGIQTVSTWTPGSQTIGAAKGDLAAWVIDNSDTAAVGADQVYLFAGTGRTGGNSATGEIRSGYLDATSTTGNLESAGAATLDNETALTPGFSAAGSGDASGFLYLFGGELGAGNLVPTDSSSLITAGPTLSAWDSLGAGSLVVERAFSGSAQESAFFFVAGGRTATAAATNSVERTVQ